MGMVSIVVGNMVWFAGYVVVYVSVANVAYASGVPSFFEEL